MTKNLQNWQKCSFVKKHYSGIMVIQYNCTIKNNYLCSEHLNKLSGFCLFNHPQLVTKK